MLRQAWIAKWRVVNRPVCPECGNFMDITFGKGIKSRYWACEKLAPHCNGGPHRRDWDAGLPAKALAYVKGLRKIRARARKRLLSDGEPHRKAMQIRHPWRRNAG
jgi:ssDNA-binding Zn-finger/Zn-ribbon topoisomerase 1